MANGLVHKTQGATYTQTEFEAEDGHTFGANQATGDLLYASSTTVLRRLGVGSNNDILTISGGIPAWTSRPTLGGFVERSFIEGMLQLGDMRGLWVPALTGTTLTDKSRNARIVTWSETIADFDISPAELGFGYDVSFNGTNEEGDVPDNNDFSFGDSESDQSCTVWAIVNPDTVSGTDVLLSKYDLTSGSTKREWRLFLNAGAPNFVLYDESAGANIGRSDATALSTGTRVLLVATYDGSAASTGIRVYVDAVRLDDTDQNSGTYVAMENTASLVRVGFEQGTSAGQSFLDGKMASWGIIGKALSQNEVWRLKEVVNLYYQISL